MRPGPRLQIAHYSEHGRGLSRTVAAEQAHHFADGRLGYAVEDVALAIKGVDVLKFEHQGATPR